MCGLLCRCGFGGEDVFEAGEHFGVGVGGEGEMDRRGGGREEECESLST